MELVDEATALCTRLGVEPEVPSSELKVGIALHTLTLRPLNGLRHPPIGDTCGWYIWGGTSLSREPDFFLPLHIHHLAEHCPEAMRYLALPPGWRFLAAPGHEDVWFDSTLLNVDSDSAAAPELT